MEHDITIHGLECPKCGEQFDVPALIVADTEFKRLVLEGLDAIGSATNLIWETGMGDYRKRLYAYLSTLSPQPVDIVGNNCEQDGSHSATAETEAESG